MFSFPEGLPSRKISRNHFALKSHHIHDLIFEIFKIKAINHWQAKQINELKGET